MAAHRGSSGFGRNIGAALTNAFAAFGGRTRNTGRHNYGSTGAKSRGYMSHRTRGQKSGLLWDGSSARSRFTPGRSAQRNPSDLWSARAGYGAKPASYTPMVPLPRGRR